MAQNFALLAKDLGLPLQLLQYGTALVLSFPLAAIYRALPAPTKSQKPHQQQSPNPETFGSVSRLLIGDASTIPSEVRLRHLYSLGVTSLLMGNLFSYSLFAEIFSTSVFVWGLSLIMKHSEALYKTNGTKSRIWFPILVFAGALLQLASHHIRYQVWDTSLPDDSAPFLILSTKLGMYAWALYDGTRPASDLSPEQMSRLIHETPSLLEFLGFIFFFPGWLVGPAIEFSDYRDFTRLEGHYKDLPQDRLIPTLKLAALGIVCLILNVATAKDFAPIVLTTNDFNLKPFWFRAVFLMIAAFMARCKFYAAWKLSESACTLVGISYNGIKNNTSEVLWNRVENVNVYDVETAQSPRAFVNQWNKNASNWLRQSVYIRISPPRGDGQSVRGVLRSREVANFATFLCSALWHGFRPSYYILFLTGAILTTVAGAIRQTVRPLFLSPRLLGNFKWLYDIASWILTQWCIDYVAVTFLLYRLDLSLLMLRSQLYTGHLLLAAGLGLMWSGWLSRGARMLELHLRKGEDDVGDEVIVNEGVGISKLNGDAKIRKRAVG
ncbi:MBOAT, membrane-bound O-acyltransferase family-domain-containing protein [Cladochytrium replicatum]|nr:MBOAT, membrane-bound O-acyltransferase family-domain-containing protein [Cladochytrium replicatum]